MRTTRNLVLLAALAVAAVAAAPAGAADAPADAPVDADSRSHVYRVTVHNLTAGQPLSPPVAVTSRHAAPITSGRASSGLEALAENGDNSLLARELRRRGATHVVALDAPIPPGERASFRIRARRGDRLSLAAMLVCTNDGYVATSGHALRRGTFPLGAYDAGTEANAEAAEFLVPPCLGGHNLNDPIDTHMRIRHHGGILGGVDLDPDVHGWDGAPARITIRRVR